MEGFAMHAYTGEVYSYFSIHAAMLWLQLMRGRECLGISEPSQA